MKLAIGFGQNAVADLQASLFHADQGDHSKVIVEPAIDDECLQRGVAITLGRRDVGDEILEGILNAHARLRTDQTSLGRVDSDDLFDLGADPFRIRLGKVHLVEDRQHFKALLDGRVAVRHRLGLYALPGIDHQKRTLAGRQGARHLVGKIDVTGGVDEVQEVGFTVTRVILKRDALGLDGDTALALDVHGIEHLVLHLAITQAPAVLDKAIGQRRLAVVDVGDDRKVADVVQFAQDILAA